MHDKEKEKGREKISERRVGKKETNGKKVKENKSLERAKWVFSFTNYKS